MEIVIVNQYAQPPDRPGGSRHHVFGRELTAKGHRVTIVAAAFSHLTRSEGSPRPPTEIVDGVRYVWIPGVAEQQERSQEAPGHAGFRRPSRRRRSNAPTSPQRRHRVIADAVRSFGGTALGTTREGSVRARSSRHLARLPDRCHRGAAETPPGAILAFGRKVPVSICRPYRSLLPDAAEVLEDRGAKRGSVVWLPNGVDAHEVGAYEPPPTSGAFTVMYAGAHGHANGLDSLVDAARALQSRRHASKSGERHPARPGGVTDRRSDNSSRGSLANRSTGSVSARLLRDRTCTRRCDRPTHSSCHWCKLMSSATG